MKLHLFPTEASVSLVTCIHTGLCVGPVGENGYKNRFKFFLLLIIGFKIFYTIKTDPM